MKQELRILTVTYLLFLALLIISGTFEGVLSIVVYLLAAILPLLFALWAGGQYNNEKILSHEHFGVTKEDIELTLPLIFPTVLAVFGISYLTSLLIIAVRGEPAASPTMGSLGGAVFRHALLPALTEELLFRYLPLRLLAKKSRRTALIASAVFFAFVHHSFFSIPYALFAGLVFMGIDLMTDSVIPSIIIHFANNLLSVIWIFYSAESGFAVGYIITLAVLAAISTVFVIIKWKKYREGIARVFSEGEKYVPSYEPLMFIVVTAALAVSELL